MDMVSENLRRNVAEVRTRRVRLESKPLQVNVELTGICNVNPPCLFCSGKNFGHKYAPLDVSYLDAYEEFLSCCRQVNEDSFGEPLGHPGLLDLARRFTGNGQVFSFVTNGLLLDRRRADALAVCGQRLGMHVSFNAASADVYYKLTGKSFERLVSNVRYYVESYRRHNHGHAPQLIATFIVMKINRNEVADFLRLAKELDVPRVMLASLHDRPSVPLGDFGYAFVYEEEMLPYEQLQKVGEEAKRLATQLDLDCLLQWNAAHDSVIRCFSEPGVDCPCLVPWRFLFIQEHTKKVFACPYHRLPYGDLERDTVEEIWNSEPAVRLREALVKDEIPKRCWDTSAGCPLVLAAGHAGVDHEIDDHVTMDENDIWQCGEGWYPLEHVPEPIRWTSAKAEFRIRIGRDRYLGISTALYEFSGTIKGQVELNGLPLGSFQIHGPSRETLLRFSLPEEIGTGVAEGCIRVEKTWMPSEALGSRDTRQLGIAVRGIWNDTPSPPRRRAPGRARRRGFDG